MIKHYLHIFEICIYFTFIFFLFIFNILLFLYKINLPYLIIIIDLEFLNNFIFQKRVKYFHFQLQIIKD